MNKCEAYQCKAWNNEPGDWDCDRKYCINNDSCEFIDKHQEKDVKTKSYLGLKI